MLMLGGQGAEGDARLMYVCGAVLLTAHCSLHTAALPPCRLFCDACMQALIASTEELTQQWLSRHGCVPRCCGVKFNRQMAPLDAERLASLQAASAAAAAAAADRAVRVMALAAPPSCSAAPGGTAVP